MVIDDFIKAIDACPDNELFKRFSLVENYIVLFKADYDKVTGDLDKSDKWSFNSEATEQMIALAELGKYRMYNDISKVVILQALSWLVPCFGAEGLDNHIAEKGYNMSFMMVHDTLEIGVLPEGQISSRHFANAVKHLLLYAKENQIPIFLPKSSMDGSKTSFFSYQP